MSTPNPVAVNKDDSIAISVAQLLELRHVPAPAARRTPVSNSTWLGAFTSHKRGHGTDYDDLRPYSPGDDIRHIDWRASARTHELHTRLYREEKDHRTQVICDLRHCMFTGSTTLRANRATILSARLLWQACHGGTQVTLTVITPTGISMIAPGSGHTAAIRGCNLLAKEHQRIASKLERGNRHNQTIPDKKQAGQASYQGKSSTNPDNTMPETHGQRHSLALENKAYGPTLDAVLQWLLIHGEHKTTQLWVSGFDYEGEHFFNTLGTTNLQTLNLAIQIDDPVLSHALPAGEFHYRSHTRTGNNAVTAHRSALVHRGNQQRLEDELNRIKHNRAARFDELMIPYLDAANGDDEVISALRQIAYLA